MPGPEEGGYLPGEDYRLDDLVTVNTGSGPFDYEEATYPIGAWRISLPENGAEWEAHAELGASYEEAREREFAVPPSNAHTHPPNPQLCRPATAGASPDILDAYGNGATGDQHHLLANRVPAGSGGLVFVMMCEEDREPTTVTYQPRGASFPAEWQTMTKLLPDVENPVSQNSNFTGLYAYWLQNPATADANARVVFDNGGGGFGMGAWATESDVQPSVDVNSGNSSTMSVTSTADIADRVMVAAGWLLWSLGDASQTPIDLSDMTDDWAIAITASAGQNDGAWFGGHAVGGGTYQVNGVTSAPWVAAAISQPGIGGAVNDGHAELVGTAPRATRCDHRHDVHRDAAPTADDDESRGYKLGTRWAVLDDLVTPTAIVAVYIAVDVSAGAAVWVEEPLHAEDHATRHASGGADAVKLDDLATPDDNTDLNASTTRHGLLRKLSGVATQYLDGSGAWSTPGGGGGAAALPTPVQMKRGAASTQNLGITMDATPTEGNRLVLGVGLNARTVTSITQTGVTWSKMSDHNNSTTMYGEIWVGVVGSGASASLTINTGSSNWIQAGVVEIPDALTPTLGLNAESNNTNFSTTANTYSGAIEPAQGTLFACLLAEDNGTTALLLECAAPIIPVILRGGTAVFGIGYAPGGQIGCWSQLATTNADGVAIICSIT